jgi:uncharacterized protein YggE
MIQLKSNPKDRKPGKMQSKSSYRFTRLLIAAIFTLPLSVAASADEDNPPPRIEVTGQGSVDIAPDMAVLTLTVTRQAETARAALDANSAAMTEVQKAMRTGGIENRDLQTSGFSIQPNYVYPAPQGSAEREPPRITGYTVRNSLTVRVRDIDNVGTILDKSVSLGVNEGGNIAFTNADPAAAITEARTRAVQDAMAKAETLAKAAGVKKGRLLGISEQSYNPRPAPMMEMAMSRAADSVPVAVGENTYSVSVNVTYAIEQ